MEKIAFSLLVLVSLSLSACKTGSIESSGMSFWFDQPAKAWNEAIPIGNGALGGMVYGGIDSDTIKINEETLWSGGPRDLQNHEAINHLPEIRNLLLDDKTKEAQALIDSTMLGPWNECYMPMGDLVIDHLQNGKANHYTRQLDLQKGMVNIYYSIGEVAFRRESN